MIAKKIAVTAASGALGSTIISRAAEIIGGENVVALARTPDKVAAPEGVEVRIGDYENPGPMTESLAGIDAVLLVSSNAPPEERPRQHGNVIEAAKKAGVRKIVYTGIAVLGGSPIAEVSLGTEEKIKESGLEWIIGRNGLYIEPDLEYIETYKKDGYIKNCAGDGRCSYTSRSELAEAYLRMLTDDSLNGGIFKLAATPITQSELAEVINQVFGTELIYKSITSEEYELERKKDLGDFMGSIVAGIYTTIRKGLSEFNSDFEKVVDRPHKTVLEMAREFGKGM